MAYTKFQEQAIYQAIQDLAEWLVPHVGKWNKWLRPTLGQQTLECVLNILRAATTAYASPRGKKLPYLERASAELDCLRLLLNISVTLRMTSRAQFEYAAKLVASLGAQLGGWLSQVRQGEGG